jgi:hypothetical protein
VQKAVRISAGELCGLAAAHDVVRDSGHPVGQLGHRPKGVERMKAHGSTRPA